MKQNNIIFKLLKYNINIKKTHRGVIVTINYIGIPIKLVFGILKKPKNNKKIKLLLVQNNVWKMINIKNNDDVGFCISVMEKFPIFKNTCVKFVLGEKKLINSVISDMINNKKITWLPKGDEYIIYNDKSNNGSNNLAVYLDNFFIDSLKIPNNETEMKNWDVRKSFDNIIKKSLYMKFL